MYGNKNHEEQAAVEPEMSHRIEVARTALLDQVAFFTSQFGQVGSVWKEDHTRVTSADLAISEQVFVVLRSEFPEDDYCSEETNSDAELAELNARYAWVLDPIDGTNNFALGFPVCGISLALLSEGIPVYGFVYDHSTQSLLEGGPGYGLFKNQESFTRAALASQAQTMIGLQFPIDADLLGSLHPLLTKYRIRSLGSGALTSAYVATGYLTGVIDRRIKVWDIAAAYALCAAVGIDFVFIGESPFPMKTFSPQMDYCPYYAGTSEFRDQVAALLLAN